MRGCEVIPCGENAYAKVRWGGLRGKVQTAHLCKKHRDELAKMMMPLLSTGMGHWTNWKPE